MNKGFLNIYSLAPEILYWENTVLIAIKNKLLQFVKPSTSKVLFLIFLLISITNFAQDKKKVEILRAGYGESDEKIAENAQRLVDSVLIRHKEILMWCDTAYTYSGTNKVDAYGNVHIKQGDTLHLYANAVLYDGDKDLARAWDNVKLINKSTTIYTDTLDYDLETKVSYYDDYGKIVDSTTTITSTIGKYYTADDLINLLDNVVVYNDDFTLESDTVKYYTETKRIYVEGPTTIRDSANTLYTEKGWYDSETGEAELLKKSNVFNDTQFLKADIIKYDEKGGSGEAFGSVWIEDFENKSIVTGNHAIYNENMESALVTDSAVYIMYSDTDSLFLHADTLRTIPDTVKDENVVFAYYGVRFFRSDLQGVCDSLVYYTKDSVIQLHQNPVIWSEIHQLSANEIQMKQRTDAPDEIHLTGKSFIISEQDSGQFDQIKGKEMVGFIVNQELDNIMVDGNGQTLYYAREEEEIIGLNQAESSTINIQFREGQIYKIKFNTQPLGELKPLFELTDEDKYLKDFDWKTELRPKSKFDIFPQTEEPIQEEGDPESHSEHTKSSEKKSESK